MRNPRPRTILGIALAFLASLGGGVVCAEPAAKVEDGVRFEPPSNHALAAEAGKRAHTFLHARTPKIGPEHRANRAYAGSPPYTGYATETPASLQCVYKFTAPTAGCDPNTVTYELSGGTKTIAIVDAYDYLAAKADLRAFSAQFGLPAPTSSNFEVVNLGAFAGSATGSGWDLEEALDIEYAHAMAPKAKIVLIEAASSNYDDMFNAVTYAAGLVKAAGGGQVSMSWGGSEFSGETGYDSYLTATNVVFYAASGDVWGTSYPCVSPNVVCVGGTSHSRNALTFALEDQWPWADEGGGTSAYEVLPSYQLKLPGAGAYRMAPDVAAIADLNNAVWVYNSTYEGAAYWFTVGGTSVATPVTAGLDNLAGNFQKSSYQYLTYLYGDATGVARTDITTGYCGYAYGLVAGKGWDNCTGWGVPRNYVLP